MTEPRAAQRTTAVLALTAMLASVAPPSTAADAGAAARLALAERFVTAFYSFETEPLAGLLAEAGDSAADMLFYQGWARGGNYIVMQRMPCTEADDDRVRCSITVQDDLVLALGIDFDVTDTFDISFSDGAISAVETSSNDPELYHDARDWVWEHHPERVREACDGSPEASPDPERCVSNMLKGYREYAQANGLTPRAAK